MQKNNDNNNNTNQLDYSTQSQEVTAIFVRSSCYFSSLPIIPGWYSMPRDEKNDKVKKWKYLKTHQFDYLCGLSLENQWGSLGFFHCSASLQSDSEQDYLLFQHWRSSCCWFPKGGFYQLTPPLLDICQWSVWSSANTKRRAGEESMQRQHSEDCSRSTESFCVRQK